jgi:hypothetical protein
MIQRLPKNRLVDWSLVTGKGNTMPPRDPTTMMTTKTTTRRRTSTTNPR